MPDNAPTPLSHSVLGIFAWVWDALAFPLMQSCAVELVNIFADDPLQMAFIHNHHMNRLHMAFAFGARTGVRNTSIPRSLVTRVKHCPYFPSLSRIRKRSPSS